LKLADIEFAVEGGEASCAVPNTLLSQVISVASIIFMYIFFTYAIYLAGLHFRVEITFCNTSRCNLIT
jgi:hypothetical protein